jgi:acetylornithine deacetylase/succinyl-diaminopimelate desuccinylase-like protein
LLGPVGLSIPAGETGFLAFEQVWSRPSFEINGIVGGYCGDGFKTVLPAKANAKISFRLVPGQDVQIVRESFRAFVRARIPADCRVDFIGHSGSPACLVPMDHPAMQACMEALRQQWKTEVAIVASGGSIPVVGHLKQVLGLDSILVGFSLPEDQVHAPNESYSISSFEGGISSWIRVLHSLADAS